MQKIRYQSSGWARFGVWFRGHWESSAMTVGALVISTGTSIAVATASKGNAPFPIWYVYAAIAFGFLLLIGGFAGFLQKSIHRQLFDVSLAVEYDRQFDALQDRRFAAATKLLAFIESSHRNWNKIPNHKEIEYVLDFLDVIGFLVHGHQMSDRVAHQYFFYWIQMYYEGARDYIRDERVKCPAAYEHIANLYEAVMVIEQAKSGGKPLDDLRLSQAELLEIVRQEIGETKQRPQQRKR